MKWRLALKLRKPRRRRQLRKENRRIALERIKILIEMAKEALREKPKLAQHYVDLARRLGMRYQVRLSPELRRSICSQCKCLIVPGVNSRIRIKQRREPHVAITCFHCGGIMRIPLRKRGISHR